MHGLEQGSAALKALQAEVNLDRVERIMDESREGIEYQREIDEALASQMSPEEEEAVLAELEALQREQMVRTRRAAAPPALADSSRRFPTCRRPIRCCCRTRQRRTLRRRRSRARSRHERVSCRVYPQLTAAANKPERVMLAA